MWSWTERFSSRGMILFLHLEIARSFRIHTQKNLFRLLHKRRLHSPSSLLKIFGTMFITSHCTPGILRTRGGRFCHLVEHMRCRIWESLLCKENLGTRCDASLTFCTCINFFPFATPFGFGLRA